MSTGLQQFVLLPPRGMTATATRSNPDLSTFLLSLNNAVGAAVSRVSPAAWCRKLGKEGNNHQALNCECWIRFTKTVRS